MRKNKILLVDDEESILKAMEKDFEQEGYSSNGAVMNKSRKLIEARHYPRLLNDYWVFGKVGLVSFIVISIAILFLTSVTQAHASTVTAQSPLPHQTQKETLIVGSEQNYPPFATGMTDADAGGFTVELWKAVAAEAGLSYAIRVNPFREVFQNFKDGETDVLINLARSEERDQFADFTVPHVIVHGAIFVRKGETSIRSEDDLVGKSIIVLNADLAHDYALTKGWKQLVLVDTAAEGFRLLASGKHDAILIGKLPGMQTILNMGLTDIKVLKFNAGFAQKFGFAVHEGQSELLSKINEGLAIVKANGTYDLLYQKWFDLYKVKEVGLQDLLKYIIPIVLFFLGVGGYFFYRRQVERQEFNTKLRLITDNAPVFLAQFNKKKNYTFVNKSYAKQFGLKPVDLIGKHAQEILSEEDFAKASPNMDIALSGQHVVYDVAFLATSEKPSVSTVHYSPEYDKAGHVVGFIAAIVDITKRKQAGKSLKDSEGRQRILLDNIQTQIWYLTDETTYGTLNKAHADFNGVKIEDLAFRNLYDIFPKENADTCRQSNTEVFSIKKTVRTEEWMPHVSGEQRLISIIKIPKLRDDRTVEYVVCSAEDITERKQAEEVLQRSHDELEAGVRERTLDLQKTYEQLLHAEKMSSIGKLSASIAHEFNNPLQGVTSIIQGIKKRADMDHDDAELMDLAIKECHRMRDLVKSLQDFNRPTSARKAPMDIHAALESILMLSKKEYATRKISITKKYAENLPQIIAVSDQLKQVFLNLLSNASDACVQGGDVRIETDSVEDNVVIRVHDTGCGISPDGREHIFDPFFTTKAEMKGTGLGLSVSYGIIKAHGGEITVDSEPGKGTTFSVVLPIKGGSDEEK